MYDCKQFSDFKITCYQHFITLIFPICNFVHLSFVPSKFSFLFNKFYFQSSKSIYNLKHGIQFSKYKSMDEVFITKLSRFFIIIYFPFSNKWNKLNDLFVCVYVWDKEILFLHYFILVLAFVAPVLHVL